MPDRTRQRLVYIEDNVASLALMEALMDELPELELQTACTAELGLSLVRSVLPDLVLMDLHLPGIDGVQAALQLRADEKTCHIPLIALTAAAMQHERRRDGVEVFDRYVTKPFRVDALVAVLRELLAHTRDRGLAPRLI